MAEYCLLWSCWVVQYRKQQIKHLIEIIMVNTPGREIPSCELGGEMDVLNTIAKLSTAKEYGCTTESNGYWDKLLQQIQQIENEAIVEIKGALLELIQNWNCSDDPNETQIILTILNHIGDQKLSIEYVKNMIQFIKKNDIDQLLFIDNTSITPFVQKWCGLKDAVVETQRISIPEFDTYAMHTNVSLANIAYQEISTLQNTHALAKKYLPSDWNLKLVDIHRPGPIHHNNPPGLERFYLRKSHDFSRTLFFIATCCIDRSMNSQLINENFVGCLFHMASCEIWYLSWSATVVLFKIATEFQHEETLRRLYPLLINFVMEFQSDEYNIEQYTKSNHIPLQFLPISMVATALEKNKKLVTQLMDIQMVEKIESWYSKFDLRKGYISRFDSVCFSQYFIILSHLSLVDDKTKLEISKSKLNKLLKLILTKHLKILQLWNLNLVDSRYRKAIKISNVAVSCGCALLSSLSRSAALLRSYFIENGYIKLLSDLLLFNIDQLNGNENGGKILYEKEYELQTKILGILSNLVIEFSTSREEFNAHEIFKVVNIFINDEIRLDRCRTSLSFIRNGLFGNDDEFREEFQKVIGVQKIFYLCESENINIQLQAFNILRNLLITVDKNNYIDYVYNEYEAFKSEDADFVEFLRNHLNSSRDLNLTVTLCYNLVHFSTLNVENKVAIIKNEALLGDLLHILQMKQTNDMFESTFWEIKTCIAWIVINLTMPQRNDINFSHDRIRTVEDYEYMKVAVRSTRLIELGFREIFTQLPTDCPSVDFVERASSALFQLLVSSDIN